MEFTIYVSSDMITIRSNAFLSEGDVFKTPTLVSFPIFVNGELTKAAAIVAKADVKKVEDIIEEINDLADDDEEGLKKALRKLPKRVWATSLLRDQVLVTTDGNTIATKAAGAYAEKLQTAVSQDEVTFEDLAKAVKASCPTSKKVVIHHHKGDDGKAFYAMSSKGKRYPIWVYCLE